jgi:ribosome-associated translation inhibitor RaiA
VDRELRDALSRIPDKLDRQVKKHKEKLSNHHPRASDKRGFS